MEMAIDASTFPTTRGLRQWGLPRQVHHRPPRLRVHGDSLQGKPTSLRRLPPRQHALRRPQPQHHRTRVYCERCPRHRAGRLRSPETSCPARPRSGLVRRVVSTDSTSPAITTTTHRIAPNLHGKHCRPHRFGSTGTPPEVRSPTSASTATDANHRGQGSRQPFTKKTPPTNDSAARAMARRLAIYAQGGA